MVGRRVGSRCGLSSMRGWMKGSSMAMPCPYPRRTSATASTASSSAATAISSQLDAKGFLHLVEEALGVLVIGFLEGRRELLQQLFLLLREVRRRHHVHPNLEVAAPILPQVRHALPLNAEDL